MQIVVQTPTPDIEKSRGFYRSLDFRPHSGTTDWFTDGAVTVAITAERTARPGIRLYAPDWDLTVRELDRKAPTLPLENGFLVGSPAGVWIYLLATDPPAFAESDSPSKTVLGQFAGVSIETLDLVRSFAFWQELGFSHNAGSNKDGWISLSGPGGFNISLMRALACPHLFPNPSLTYFNGKNNPAVIAELRARAISIAEEITVFNPAGEVDNVLLRDPGGLGVFVFND